MKAPKRQRPRGRPPAEKGNATSGKVASGESFASREHDDVSTPPVDDETDPPLLVVEVVVDPLDLLLTPSQQHRLDRLIAALSDPEVDIADQLAEEIDHRLQTAVRVALVDLLFYDPAAARRQRLLDERRVIQFSEFNNRRIARLAASDPDDGDDGDGGGA